MKKNGEFVGVDEKFIPEDEKYVDESLLGNKEETKEKVKKVAKGIGIGYLCFIGFIVILTIGIMIFGFTMFNKTMNIFTETKDQILDTDDKINSIKDSYNGQVSDMEEKSNISSFNNTLEMYSGTKYGSFVISLLDQVVTSNKTNSEHIITVVYKETTTTSEDDIAEIKHGLDKFVEYEVSLDYDANGYINKVTVKDI